jgi:uncharacterized membrane-anchored protein
MPAVRLAGVLSVLLAALAGSPAAAQSPSTTPEEFEAKLGYRSGRIDLRNGLATLEVPASFRFIGTEGSARLIEEGWGNPPGSGEDVIGMLVPAALSPLSKEGWGVIITYDEDGYIDDKGAESMDYGKLLKQLQESTEETNAERKKEGFEPVHLIGWAEPPSYNAATHKMYWAKELAFGDEGEHTLNYNVRVLGRRGVLVLNAVAGMSQLPSIRADMQQVLGFVEFQEGHRYADYIPGKDKAATYGLAGLVVGAVAAKAGFFKVLLAGILAAKKLILVALLGAGAFLKRFLGGRARNAEGGPA